jgi:hypothetical protein
MSGLSDESAVVLYAAGCACVSNLKDVRLCSGALQLFRAQKEYNAGWDI